MIPILGAVFSALRVLRASLKGVRLKMHLFGTSGRASCADDIGIRRMASDIGVGDLVEVRPERLPYLDALRTMHDADLLLMIGSLDSHYTASKLFPCWLARRPLLGVFHEDSTVIEMARQLGGVTLVAFGAAASPADRIDQIALAMRTVLSKGQDGTPPRHDSAFQAFDGRRIAGEFASLFDRVAVGAPRDDYFSRSFR